MQSFAMLFEVISAGPHLSALVAIWRRADERSIGCAAVGGDLVYAFPVTVEVVLCAEAMAGTFAPRMGASEGFGVAQLVFSYAILALVFLLSIKDDR